MRLELSQMKIREILCFSPSSAKLSREGTVALMRNHKYLLVRLVTQILTTQKLMTMC